MTADSFKAKVKQNVADNFNQSCQIYRAFEGKHRFFADLTLKLAENIGLRQGARVLDVGCGNGISAVALNQRYGCKVLGVDLSPKMVAAGQAAADSENVQLVVGDGEHLASVTGGALFDYVLYNASIFIFPDVARTLSEAFACLRPGGKIAFSFYPLVLGKNEEDLMEEAFKRLGEPVPRFRVITDYPQACQALASQCGCISQHRWVWKLNIEFLKDFFSIPAQSASLFPGRDYQVRRELVNRLFVTLEDAADYGTIVWRMAEGVKPA